MCLVTLETFGRVLLDKVAIWDNVLAEVISTCPGLHNLHYCQEMLERTVLRIIVFMVLSSYKSRSTFLCFEIRTARSVWKEHPQMGFSLECPMVQLAFTMDMKGIHEVVSPHLQKAFWTTGTAWFQKDSAFKVWGRAGLTLALFEAWCEKR